MRILITYIATAILLACGFHSKARQADSLLLQTVVEKTLAGNPSIQASSFAVKSSEGLLRASWGKFNTDYSFSINKSQNRFPTSYDVRNGLSGTAIPYVSEPLLTYGLAASKLLTSGAVFSAGANYTNFGHDDLYKDLKSEGYGSLITSRGTIYASISQPLARGRGKFFNTANIEIAKYSLNAQQQRYSYEASLQVLESALAYIDYVAAYNNLRIQQQNEESFQRSVRDLERMVSLDLIPAADLLFIKANAASQSNSRTYAQNSLAYTRNLLGAQMGLSNEETAKIPLPFQKFPIEAVNLPDTAYLKIWLEKGLEQRGDYQALMKFIESSKIQVEFNRQQIRPDIALNARVGYSGIDEGTGLGQAFSPFYSNVPGLNVSVGVSMGIAPRFDRERGQLSASLADLEQTQYQALDSRNRIWLSIKRYYDQMRYFSNVVEASRLATKYNETALSNEYMKLKLGSSTVINVVQIQNNYVVSLNSLNRALQDLNTAFFLFKFHTGSLVQANEGQPSINFDNFLSLPSRE